jgi:diaminohydroxyphosphoribosylaminopyrimidine deaminase/5-amino-6-(5-phosphoribosylamino)uracil reductase
MTELDAMRQALDLALRGWGRVAPNPLVGAVLLKDGEVVGVGHHREYGAPHAEVEALSACDDPHGTTCVVNLEPCSHRGQTPPCTDALLMTGVARVVAAVRDPDPKAGGGVEYLRRHGVEVEIGVGREAAAALNAPFLWAHVRSERPFLALKVATSLDGFIADKWGKSQWITGEEARAHVHWLRAGFDAIGVGRRTADRDDPMLTARGTVLPRVPPTRVVFSPGGVLRSDIQLVRSADTVPTVLVTRSGSRQNAEHALAGSGVQILEAEGLEEGLEKLRDKGIRSLLLEGGSELAGAFLDTGLVDRIYWYQAPILLGEGLRAFPQRTAVELDQAHVWVPTERKTLGDSNLLVVDRELCLPG